DEGDDAVLAAVTNDDGAPAAGVGVRLGPEDEGDLRGRVRDHHRAHRAEGSAVALGESRLEREDVGAETAGDLLAEGVIVGGQQPGIERLRQFTDPTVVETVEDAVIDTGPVMYGHGFAPAGYRGTNPMLPAGGVTGDAVRQGHSWVPRCTPSGAVGGADGDGPGGGKGPI